MADTTRILIIDDEAIVLKSCRKIFRRRPQYDIETASSGAEGLQKAGKEHYDLVITDLKMPGMSGMDVLKQLRDKQPDVTVIVFTGYATVETAREALKLGAFDYVPKPFTPDELREVVDNAVMSRKKNTQAKMLDVMAIVSHELKSPVAAMHTNAETLFKGYFGNLPQDQQKTIETILRNCEYLEDIIRNYLDLSKMEMNDIEAFKKQCDLISEVIQPVISVPETAKNIKNMPILTKFHATPLLQGDPNLLRIVITNLVSNGIKYGKAGTPVEITVEETDNQWTVHVYNEGVGIAPSDIETRLFGKFLRLKQKGTEGVKGSGLGLYICKTIVEKHGGNISVESEEGKWVRFSVCLPKTSCE